MGSSTQSADFVTGAFSLSNLTAVLGLWISYHVVVALYNISPFHPLSAFPGPKIAAATILYEFWYDMILVGRYTHKIKELHDIYGPIVRISPNELHCNDPSFVDEIYAGAGRKRNKQEHYLASTTGPATVSAFGTVDHDMHRLRRNATNKFFSKAQIYKLEPEMRQLVTQLCEKLLRNPTKGPVNITTAYSCFTTDMISAYCFGEPLGFLTQPTWEPNFREAMNAFLDTTFLFRYFPFLGSLVAVAPKMSKYMGDDIRILMDEMYVHTPARIIKSKQDRAAGVKFDRPTVFTDILDSSLPDSEKSVHRLSGEGFSIVGAGTETTSWVLTVITYYLLSQPATLAKLTEALANTDPENLKSWSTLEKIPYLYAVIMEGLRLSYGVTARSPRVPRDENLVYHGQFQGKSVDYVIPRGTAIGVSSALLHHNKEIFPDSEKFVPERWIDEQGQRRKEPERGFFSFSRGSRQCLGMNLAYCEVYLATAALAQKVFPHMKLYQTTVDDVKYDHDLVVCKPKKSSKGVRVTIQ